MKTTLLDLIADYGPAVYADPELGIVIQRNGAYLNLAVEGPDGWHHTECRAVDVDAYGCTLAQAMDSAKEWAAELAHDGEEQCSRCGEWFTPDENGAAGKCDHCRGV